MGLRRLRSPAKTRAMYPPIGRQSGPARLHRNPLRLCLGNRQQWQLLRRTVDQHSLLQHYARRSDADRTVPPGDPALGSCRLVSARHVAPSIGSMPTHSSQFVGLLVAVVLIF